MPTDISQIKRDLNIIWIVNLHFVFCSRFKDLARSANEVVFLPFSTFSHLKDKLQVLKKVQLPLGPPRRSPPPSSHHPVSYFDTFFARKLVRLATSNNFCCFFHPPRSISSSPSQRKSCQIKIAAVIKFGSFLALIHKRLSDGFNTFNFDKFVRSWQERG